jgi:hypothetical protein
MSLAVDDDQVGKVLLLPGLFLNRRKTFGSPGVTGKSITEPIR